MISHDANTAPSTLQQGGDPVYQDVELVVDVPRQIETKLVAKFVEMSSLAPAHYVCSSGRMDVIAVHDFDPLPAHFVSQPDHCRWLTSGRQERREVVGH